MGTPYWFGIVLVILRATVISVISHSRGDPPTLAILKYFHPPTDEPNFYVTGQDCSDPCVLNVTLLSKSRERMESRCCCKHLPNCTEEQKNSPFRSIDGNCNNLLHPDWGMSETCHRRFLPHDYGDGRSYPRLSCLRDDLPNARIVSNILHKDIYPMIQTDMTLFNMQWGQLISHDISLASIPPASEMGPDEILMDGNASPHGAPLVDQCFRNKTGVGADYCCDPYPRIDQECIAVVIPYDDDFYSEKRITCLPYARTKECHLCTGGVRQSLNNNTSYFDLSVVYGSSEEKLRSLRSYRNGMLRTQRIPGVGELPPPIEEISDCKSFNFTQKCFNAGDGRINQNLLLTSLQTILLLNHNNICRKLMEVNPHWDDDRLFQEARRVNVAQAQMITFGKYLERVLGVGITRDPEFELDVPAGKKFSKYDENVQSTVYDEVAAAAHRLGHTQIPNVLLEKDPVSGRHRTIHMKDYFFWPFEFYSGQFDRLALGMTIEQPKYRSCTLNYEVRNYLYRLRNEEQFYGWDLAVLSIARGREHGIPGYTYYLKYFFNYTVRSFCDLRGWIPGRIIEKMKSIYRSVHDVDLYTSILSENHVDGGIIGPTGAAMLATQYRNIKFGDRYYFEHQLEAGSFTHDQLLEIKEKTNLAKIICETTKISRIQPEVFFPVSERNRPVSCEELPEMDLIFWKEN